MHSLTYDKNGFIIDGNHVVLTGGEFHYFRVPVELWEDRIRMMAQAGCNLLTTYIPWNWHEAEQGKLNWSGDRDLALVLDLCKKYGLYVILKPGPYICGEWNFGGFPKWFLKKEIDIRVDREPYMSLTAKWFKDIAEVIRPYLVTHGGNVISIQIENEYDHLMKYRKDITGDKATARAYILKLLQTLRDADVDIPAYTVEGTPVMGTEIINANTYYPNIPWIVMWVFDYFDDLVETSTINQPDKPLMVIEAQGGWFSQYKYDIYELEVEAFESIGKTVIGHGASALNYYMFVGGTNFPYWGSRGDFGGIGMTSTYDFGGAAIREWGETHPRYAVARAWNNFLKTFPAIVSESSTNKSDIRLIAGSEDLICLEDDKAATSEGYKNSYAEIKVLLRKGPNCSGALVRNVEPDGRSFQLAYRSSLLNKEVKIPHAGTALLDARSSIFVPLDVTFSPSVKMVYSTSELLFKKQVGTLTYVFLKGRADLPGEMLFSSSEPVKILCGGAKKTDTPEGCLLRYTHGDGSAFDVGDHRFILLDRAEGLKTWLQDSVILKTDCYHVDSETPVAGGVELSLLVKNQGPQKTSVWKAGGVSDIQMNGKAVSFKQDKATGAVRFDLDINEAGGTTAVWEGNWKYTGDSDEKSPDYDDSSWTAISATQPLEREGYFELGYYWYRHEFNVAGKADGVSLNFKTNDMDRFLVFLNGELIDVGTSSFNKEISGNVQKGRNVLAVLYANEFRPKAHPHEGPVQKVSGMYEPVVFSGTVGGSSWTHTVDQWKLRVGLMGDIAGFADVAFDDAKWQIAPTGKKYVIQQDVGNLVWLRRNFRFTKKDDWKAPLYIKFSGLKERCMIYVNGMAIGRHEACGPQFEYYVPDNILREENQVTLLLEGPCLHYRKHLGFRPAWFTEPEFGVFYEAKEVQLTVR